MDRFDSDKFGAWELLAALLAREYEDSGHHDFPVEFLTGVAVTIADHNIDFANDLANALHREVEERTREE